MMVWAGFEFLKLGVTSESLWNRDIVISHSSGCFQIKKLSSWWGGGAGVGGNGLCQAPGRWLLVGGGVRQAAAA